MLEAEVKIQIGEEAAGRLRARLAELGAAAGPLLAQTDVYFAHPARDFRASDEALRLRLDAHGLAITYKGPKLDPPRKTREEIELPLRGDLEAATTLLRRLGFEPAATVRKDRTEFRIPGPPAAVVSLDVVAGLGTYCEVEVSTETVHGGRAALAAVCRTLGLAAERPIPESYLELLGRASRR